MKIYVDFDRTLFDCDKFLEDFYALVSKYEIPKELFKKSQNQLRRHGFNPYNILDNLEKKLSFNKAIYQDIDELIHNTSNYLYSDAISFLEYLKKLNYSVIILTKGNSDFQREKIFNAKLDKYYDKLIVTMRHKGFLFLNYSHSVFVDDNPREIKSLLMRMPKKVVCMRHVNSKYSLVEVSNKVDCFSSLTELMNSKILENIK